MSFYSMSFYSMSFYSNYKGKSIGRLLHYLSVYCGSYSNVRVDELIFDKNTITYFGDIFATYQWNEEVPHFHFVDKFNNLEKQQFIKKPFIDNFEVLSNINFAVQELTKVLTLDEAFYAIFARDRWDGDFKAVIYNNSSLVTKIYDSLKKSYWGKDFILQYPWEHFLLSAVYGITMENYLP